jgi:hypothetical protein
MQEISLLAADLLASQEGFCSMEFVRTNENLAKTGQT